MKGKRVKFNWRMIALAAALSLSAFIRLPAADAACPNNAGTYGSVSGSFTIPAAGTYKVWSRIMPDASSTTNDSYTLEIDGTTCGVTVGDAGTLPANTWTWVDYQNGNTASKVTVTLSAGTHTYTMFGRESNVMVDRVIFASNAACVISGLGDNCIPSAGDTTYPTVSLTAPTNGSTVSNTVTVTANAADNVGVAAVSFYLDGSATPFATDSTSPYSVSWVTSGVSNGSHTLTAKAADTSGLVTTSSGVAVTVANTVPDTTSPTVSFTAPSVRATLSGTTTVTMNASDNVGVTRVELYADGTLIGTDTQSPYNFSVNTTSYTNGSHTFMARAYDTANNTPGQASVTVTVNNVIATPKAGDVNGDNKIDVFDASILLSNWGKSGMSKAQGDLNADGTVNVFDASILLANWGK